jgi:hypothetical protein
MSVENTRQNDAKMMPKESLKNIIFVGGLSALMTGINMLPANAGRLNEKNPNNQIETLQIDNQGNISLKGIANKLRLNTEITGSRQQINEAHDKGVLKITINKDGKREVVIKPNELKEMVTKKPKINDIRDKESNNTPIDTTKNPETTPSVIKTNEDGQILTKPKEVNKTTKSFWNENWQLITGSISSITALGVLAWKRGKINRRNSSNESNPQPETIENLDDYRPLGLTYDVKASMREIRRLHYNRGNSYGGMIRSNVFDVDENSEGTPITFYSNEGIFTHGVFYNIYNGTSQTNYTNGMSLLNTGDYNSFSDEYNAETGSISNLQKLRTQELINDIKTKCYEVYILNDVVLTKVLLNELGPLYYIYAKPIITNGVLTSNIVTLIAKKQEVEPASIISLIPSYGNESITENYKESVTENFNEPKRESILSYSAMIVELRKLAILNSYGSYLATPETRKRDDLAIIDAIKYLQKLVLGGGDGNKYGIDTWTGNGFAKFIPRLFKDNNKETREAQNIYSQNELNYLVPSKEGGKLEPTFYGFDKISIEFAGIIKAVILTAKRAATRFGLKLAIDRAITNSNDYNVKIVSRNKAHAEIVVNKKHAELVVNKNDGRSIL